MTTPDALLGIGTALGLGLYAWFLSVPLTESFYEMVTGTKPEPGSRRYRSIRRQRWFGTLFCAAMLLYILVGWAAGHHL